MENHATDIDRQQRCNNRNRHRADDPFLSALPIHRRINKWLLHIETHGLIVCFFRFFQLLVVL